MDSIFDPFNLLLLGIALVIFWRLRGVLGSRTGNERPPFDPYAASKAEAPVVPEKVSGTVLRFPKENDVTPVGAAQEPPVPAWTGYAPEGSELAAAIIKLTASDPAFSPKSFVDGAKLAYEMIVEGFAKGDKAALKELLSRDVIQSFTAAIDARNGIVHEGRYHDPAKTQQPLWDHVTVVREIVTRLVFRALGFEGRYVSHLGGYHEATFPPLPETKA